MKTAVPAERGTMKRAFWAALLLISAAVPVRADLRKDIEFARPGGVSLTLDAYVPDGSGPFPTAILVHGGGFTGGTKTSFITPLFQPLSDARFTWFTINYRLAPAHRYPACVEDVETAIRWVKDHAAEYKVDRDRIALIGESAGGHLVSFVGARSKGKTRVAAVVPFYAPHDLEYQADWRKGLGPSLTALFGLQDLNAESRKVLLDASPSTYVKPGLPPYLLIHGTKDEQVPYDQSVRFRELMEATGNRCDLLTIPNGRHGMGGWDSSYPQYKQILIEWLNRTLGRGD
jgi:alpha-L-fucosidase 2